MIVDRFAMSLQQEGEVQRVLNSELSLFASRYVMNINCEVVVCFFRLLLEWVQIEKKPKLKTKFTFSQNNYMLWTIEPWKRLVM